MCDVSFNLCVWSGVNVYVDDRQIRGILDYRVEEGLFFILRDYQFSIICFSCGFMDYFF